MIIRKLSQQIICDYGVAEVDTRQGRLRGVLSDDTFIFRGVPYAKARRFRMPEPPDPWSGVREAIVYGYVCPELTTPIPHDQYTVPHYFYPQNENCHYLNIWTGSLDPKAKKPVMVWLHGGGFATGSGVEHFAYDGENLCRYGNVVAVTLNHRLNVLGHLDLSAYEPEFVNSGNVGLADIVAALIWIHENISAFGGDPDNVTIFGQSGGGGKVAALMQMPSADGLFHRAIIQSGVTRKFGETTPEQSHAFAERLLQQLGIGKEGIDKLTSMPYYRLAETVREMNNGAWANFGPVNDGTYYKGSIFYNPIREHAKKIPVIVGSVFGEFSHNFNYTLDDGRKNSWGDEKRKGLVMEKLGNAGTRAISAFARAYPEKNIADILFMDTMFRSGALEYAHLRALWGCAATYNYIFNLEFPLYGGTLAWHNAEIPYVFHNADYIEPAYIPGVTESLQDAMCSAWTSFAQNGVPSAQGIPAWEPYTAMRPSTMVFDRIIRQIHGDDRELLRILASVKIELKPYERESNPGFLSGPQGE